MSDKNDAASELDLRRQAQIANQVTIINRLLHDGKYDSMVQGLQQDLVNAQASLRELREAGKGVVAIYDSACPDWWPAEMDRLREVLGD